MVKRVKRSSAIVNPEVNRIFVFVIEGKIELTRDWNVVIFRKLFYIWLSRMFGIVIKSNAGAFD